MVSLVAMMFVASLGDAGVVLAELPPLGTSAPRVGVRLERAALSDGPCVMERLKSSTPGVRWVWRSGCGLDWVQRVSVTPMGAVAFGNYDFSPVFLFDDSRAVKVDVKASAPFAREAVERVRVQLKSTLPPGVRELAVDARDQSVIAARDGQLLRGRANRDVHQGWAFEDLFPTTQPKWVQAQAIVWDRDRSVKRPWAVWERIAEKQATLELVAPDDTSTTLLTRAATWNGITTRRVEALRLPNATLPIISLLTEAGAHVLLTPDGSKEPNYQLRAFHEVPISLPADVPTGASSRPDAARRCSETVRSHVGEIRATPALFEWGGRAFLVWGVDTTRSAFRFTLVPQGGATPERDSFACQWVVDQREVESSLVIAAVTSDGQAEERFRLSLPNTVQQLVIDRGAEILTVIAKAMEFYVISLDPKVFTGK